MGALGNFGFGFFPCNVKFNPNTDMTYTGSRTILDDGNGNWRVKFLTSGTLTFLKDPKGIDLFLVGGGGSGAQAGGGGGGGYTGLWSGLAVAKNVGYPIVVGAGGAGVTSGSGNDGGSTFGFSHSVSGGKGGKRGVDYVDRGGGNGGSGGGGYDNGAGGTNGGNGENGRLISGSPAPGGIGQGSTTKEFHEASGTLYSTGGHSGPVNAGAANTGDGGDGFGLGYNGMAGGSGIVVIRNHT